MVRNGPGGLSRRAVVRNVAVASVGAGVALGAMAATSGEASASVAGLDAEDVSVSGVDGELAALTVAPDVRVGWEDLSRPVGDLELRVAAKVPLGGSGEVTTHRATGVSGRAGSYDHSFAEQDLLSVLDAGTFSDDTADGEPTEVDVDLSVGVTFSDGDGEQFGPAPVDLLSFTVSVSNVAAVTATPAPTDAAEERTCRGEPEDCEGVSMSGSANTNASPRNATD